jgi:uncharacterized protein YjbI with pentapeptide repeats
MNTLKLETKLMNVNEIAWERTLTYDYNQVQDLADFITQNGININPIFVASILEWNEKTKEAYEKYTLISDQLLFLACLRSEVEYVNVIVLSDYSEKITKANFVAENELLNKIQKTAIPFVKTEYVSPEPPELVKKIITAKTKNFEGQNLTGANFEGQDLKDVNFENANLTGVNFKDADLTGAIFEGAILTKTDFTDANLTNAKITLAWMSKTNFTKANLTNANLTYSWFHNAVLTNSDLSNANLSNATFRSTCLDDAKFNENTKLTNTK